MRARTLRQAIISFASSITTFSSPTATSSRSSSSSLPIIALRLLATTSNPPPSQQPTLSNLPTITPAIESRLQSICDRHKELLKHIEENTATASMTPQEMAKCNKELSDLDDVVQAIDNWKKLKEELHSLTSMINDDSEDTAIRQLAMDERNTIMSSQIPHVEQSLLLSLLPKDTADERDIILEVRAGTGGDEACLFAGELFRMYERYATINRWKFEVVEYAGSELGGCRLATAEISSSSNSNNSNSSSAYNNGIYGRLKFESGVHRVQRVPATESGGRVHTSAASVAVLPQAEDVDVHVRDEDLRIDVYRAGGAGGQHVNTTNSAVRITHIPTGIAVAIQDERSQHKNKAKALKVLRARLFDIERQKTMAERSSARKQLIGTGDRSERVRTYNFPQGRVTDHRIGLTEHDVHAVMDGERLDVFVDALRMQHQADLLANLG